MVSCGKHHENSACDLSRQEIKVLDISTRFDEIVDEHYDLEESRDISGDSKGSKILDRHHICVAPDVCWPHCVALGL